MDKNERRFIETIGSLCEDHDALKAVVTQCMQIHVTTEKTFDKKAVIELAESAKAHAEKVKDYVSSITVTLLTEQLLDRLEAYDEDAPKERIFINDLAYAISQMIEEGLLEHLTEEMARKTPQAA